MNKKIKKIIKMAISVYVLPLAFLMKCRRKHIRDHVLSSFFALFHRLSKDGDKIFYSIIEKKNKGIPKFFFDDCAIVMQGKVVLKNDYTYNVLLWYRSLYPNIKIVVSTWKDDNLNAFKERCKKIKVDVLENDYPQDPGCGHVNYQIWSSLSGVKFFENDNKIKYILKCRTDQEIGLPNFINYFKDLLEVFPVNNEMLEKRIIFLSQGSTHKWIPFHVCDFISFGCKKDMIYLYDIPFQNSNKEYIKDHLKRWENLWLKSSKYELLPLENYNEKVLEKWNRIVSRYNIAEIYIMKRFFNNIYGRINENEMHKQYWKLLRESLIIVDASTILFSFPKYEWLQYSFRTCYERIGNLSFCEWLNIYKARDNK